MIPTGSIELDAALGVGGWPAGRTIEIYGPEGAGKTTLALSAIANAQAMGGHCAIIDADMALDPNYATSIGIDLTHLVASQPDTAEQAFIIAETLVQSGSINVVVIDSLPALVTRAEVEGEMGEDHDASQIEVISQALRRLSGQLYRAGCLLIIVNQIRLQEHEVYGDAEITPGGYMLKAQASVRVDVRGIGLISRGERTVGQRVRASIVKSKVAPPFRAAEFDLLFGEGICGSDNLMIARRDIE